MAIDKKLIDQLLTDYKTPEDIIGENGTLNGNGWKTSISGQLETHWIHTRWSVVVRETCMTYSPALAQVETPAAVRSLDADYGRSR
jgi:hypothetical protein